MDPITDTLSDLYVLRARWQAGPDPDDQPEPTPELPACRCGNLLTISDRNICRECRRSA